ncbi:hypothetical protein AMJ40_07715 [candidate division TA06 bacterium DG_26]|uniref:C_GCAxxG_C_C family protein n=1 Tax=candidate division TA06 bacterium DG_26 TaxID=1703771 RepID=A0A0S7WEE4_UNCT6|nr:MAG: hypothetical protein AMJ40_07715 [candidate division TA06 bacterium DG_26]
MSRVDLAVARFKEGFSCSQAVLSTYGAQFGLDHETTLRLACAFGGGMGRMAMTCGAVTGAFMVIGLKHGRTRIHNEERRERTYELAREFTKRFISRNGSIICKDLLGCDISTPDGIRIAREEGIIATLCPKLVQDAAEIVEGIL